MAGRASIVGAAATHVGKVRDHNEDAHFLDVDLGVFLVCDGMGGHAAGEVASDLAIQAIRREWGGQGLHDAVERWLERGTPDAKKQLLDAIRAGVVAAHDSILAEAGRDETKSGMGTTLVGAVIVGGDLVFAHAGDSRAYLVRDGISMQLTEDHTLLARLLAAGIDVDVSGEGSRFRSMLTNALGIGDEVKVSTFVVPLADGDRFLLCSDGISEYVPENEVGDVLTKQPSPARAAQRLIDLALERGGGDNATAVVVRVLEAGETPLPAEQRKKDDAAINACALWAKKVTPQQRLRALRIAIPRDHNFGEKLPPHALGDRVAWIVLEGEVVQDGEPLGPGALIYPESLLGAREALPPPGRDALAITRSDVRALAIRADDFRELCDDDGELGEALLDSLAAMIRRKPRPPAREAGSAVDPRGNTDPHLPAVSRDDAGEAADDPEVSYAASLRESAETLPDEPTRPTVRTRPPQRGESAETLPDEPTRPTVRTRPPRRGESAETLPDEPTKPTVRTRPPREPVRPASQPPEPVRPASQPPEPVRSASQPPEPVRSASQPPEPVRPASRPPSRPSPPPQIARRAPPQPPTRPSLPPESVRPASQPPTRPSPPPEPVRPASQPPEPVRPASQPPMRPSPPPGPSPSASPPPSPSAPPPGRAAPSPAQAQSAGSLPRTPTPAHGVPKSPVAGRARSTPAGGIAPVTRGELSGKAGATASAPPPAVKPASRPASAPGKAAPVRSGAAWDNTAQRTRGESPWDSSGDDADVLRGGADEPTPKGFARALTPPTGATIRRDATPIPLRIDGPDLRTPSDPEIETYLEIEADLPPSPGAGSDLESELALSMVIPRNPDDEHESMSITFEDEGRRVIETTTETDSHTLTVTVTEPFGEGDDRQRAITAEDGTEVSGTISIPEDPPPTERRRAKRHSEGWDD